MRGQKAGEVGIRIAFSIVQVFVIPAEAVYISHIGALGTGAEADGN